MSERWGWGWGRKRFFLERERAVDAPLFSPLPLPHFLLQVAHWVAMEQRQAALLSHVSDGLLLKFLIVTMPILQTGGPKAQDTAAL